MKKHTQTIAFSGIISALCVVFLYLGSAVEVLDYSVSILCGILVTFAITEFGNRAGLSVWLVSSILAIILLPQKLSALLFICFCGWYTFLKRVYEKLPRLLSWILKLATFNSALAVIFYLTVKFLLFENVQLLSGIFVAILSNFVFVIYDILLTRLTFLYLVFWRKKLTFLKR